MNQPKKCTVDTRTGNPASSEVTSDINALLQNAAYECGRVATHKINAGTVVLAYLCDEHVNKFRNFPQLEIVPL